MISAGRERPPKFFAHCAHEPGDEMVKNSLFSQGVLKQHDPLAACRSEI
jgi:hypothetical protein